MSQATTAKTTTNPTPRRYPHLTGEAAWRYVVGPPRCAECGSSPAGIYMPMMGAHLCEPCHQSDPEEA